MIWEHRPGSIVMLTKLVEGGKRKCELYWPEKVGDTFKAGCGIHVQYKEVVPFADFEIKKFIVTNDQKPKVPALEVQHFQFLSWPDHGVPKFSTALISFIRRLRQYHNPQSAMLVHCSAGVGRTGAFILLDSMLEKIASESSVNVYECLTKMRQQRIHLVQTLVQYVFIHDALVELVTCGDTSVPAKALRGHIKKMVRNIPGGDVSGFTAQFRLLARVSRKPSDSDNSEGLAPHNKDKNRYPGRIPYNMNRVRLKPTGVSGAEYINASFLDGYKQKNAYMAAQAPVAATVNDFWRMVWEFKSRAVVMLCQLEENGQEMSHQYWPTQLKAKQLYGKNSVTLISEEHPFGAKEIVVRKFEITDEKNTAVFTVTQYHVLCWAEEGKMAAGLLLQMISDLNKLQRNTENKPITVVCKYVSLCLPPLHSP
ncbi:Receptor-type tyrosine-protein phosphatase F [Geodia barretti]|uniref:Receptor-type tyrosine-protein phosphatase F n=1 Tax=Geodia barretti TaxID=519541 RepID=A0AA35XA62_GEOBA|nr:Receptor-type tyrosine-protein phosphatase F [Geodia barretti]